MGIVCKDSRRPDGRCVAGCGREVAADGRAAFVRELDNHVRYKHPKSQPIFLVRALPRRSLHSNRNGVGSGEVQPPEIGERSEQHRPSPDDSPEQWPLSAHEWEHSANERSCSPVKRGHSPVKRGHSPDKRGHSPVERSHSPEFAPSPDDTAAPNKHSLFRSDAAGLA
eukprot:gnl/TRDRNA2_/TRDRNA2_137598_c0_seq1.p2 gnl/TRDRNA2_/TRDRNA2_137598_c0~~gnl/TRDRNA2_/TRDRNA2_137598_c0_seq1.p2  ORF type:complete len:168 (-),score=20.86 gnl/TRDRNA2_/TRDRNA2_137598_c0_seq1:155-658(-)